jgi:hypothetical protein
MWPISPKVRDLKHDPRYALHSLMDNFEGVGGEFFVAGRAARSTTGLSSRRRASGSTIQSSTSSSSSASTRRSGPSMRAKNRPATVGVQADSQAPLGQAGRRVRGEPAERSFERSVKRSRERSPERSSPLSPEPREPAGRTPCGVERLLVRLNTLRVHARGASIFNREIVFRSYRLFQPIRAR